MRKIALWRTVGAAYEFVFTKPGAMIRLAWPAAVPLAVFGLIPLLRPTPPGHFALFLAGQILSIAATVIICAAMARAILVAEVPWTAALALGKAHGRFFGAGLLIFLPMSLGAYLVSQAFSPLTLASVQSPGSVATMVMARYVLPFLAQMALWSVMGRFALAALPAIAAGEGSGTLRRAWTRTRGNVWSMLFGSMLCWIPFQFLQQAATQTRVSFKTDGKSFLISDLIGSSLPVAELASLVMNALMSIASVSLALAFLTFAYAQLARADLAQTLAARRARPLGTTAAIP